MNSRTYSVTITHPTNCYSGTHTVSCLSEGDTIAVRSSLFGRSRDYGGSDTEAIRAFMDEHGLRVTRIVSA